MQEEPHVRFSGIGAGKFCWSRGALAACSTFSVGQLLDSDNDEVSTCSEVACGVEIGGKWKGQGLGR